MVHKIVSKTLCSEPGAPQMSNPSSRATASGEICILAGEKAQVVDCGSAGVLLLLRDC